MMLNFKTSYYYTWYSSIRKKQIMIKTMRLKVYLNKKFNALKRQSDLTNSIKQCYCKVILKLLKKF